MTMSPKHFNFRLLSLLLYLNLRLVVRWQKSIFVNWRERSPLIAHSRKYEMIEPKCRKKRKTNKVLLFIVGSRKRSTSERDANTSTGKKKQNVIAQFWIWEWGTSQTGRRLFLNRQEQWAQAAPELDPERWDERGEGGGETKGGQEAEAPGGRMPAAI